MGEITKLHEAISKKAENALEKEIKNALNCGPFDLTNNWIDITDAGSICESGENKGKRTVRIEEVIRLIKKSLFEAYKDRYEKEEQLKFLREIEHVRYYIQQAEGNQ